MTAFNSSPHSANIRLCLRQGDKVVPLSHVAPDFVVFAVTEVLCDGDGEIIVEIDGETFTRKVMITAGRYAAVVRCDVGTI